MQLANRLEDNMANAITGGNDLFSAFLNGREQTENRNFLARQWDNVSATVNARGRAFMDKARAAFDEYDTDVIDRGLRAIRRKLDNRWGDNDIKPLGTIGEFQNASVKMIRWMSANPRIRKQKAAGRCAGWGDMYVDMEPGLWGERHTDYQRVMNGMAVTDDEGHTTYTTHFNAIDDGEEELTFGEQIDILRSWERLEMYMDQNLDDPTCQNNNAL
jgi:hypothetical protein